jgi:hypothetical protein
MAAFKQKGENIIVSRTTARQSAATTNTHCILAGCILPRWLVAQPAIYSYY